MPVVTRYDYGPTGFTAAHLGHVELHRWHTPAGLVTGGARADVRGGTRSSTPTTRGSTRSPTPRGSAIYYDDELRAVDRLVGDVLEALPPGAVLVVTADHGQVRGRRRRSRCSAPSIMAAVTLISGEGPVPLVAPAPGTRAEDVAATAPALHGDVAWVRTREQIIDGRLARRRAVGRGGGAPG